MRMGPLIAKFAELGVRLVGTGRRVDFYYGDVLIPACTPDDPWAIDEVVQLGVPREAVLAVSDYLNEGEREDDS